MEPTIKIKRHYEHDGEGHLVWPDEVIEALAETFEFAFGTNLEMESSPYRPFGGA